MKQNLPIVTSRMKRKVHHLSPVNASSGISYCSAVRSPSVSALTQSGVVCQWTGLLVPHLACPYSSVKRTSDSLTRGSDCFQLFCLSQTNSDFRLISAGWKPTACVGTPFSYTNTIVTSSHVTLKETQGPSYQMLLKFPQQMNLSQVIMILVWFMRGSNSDVGHCFECADLVFNSLSPPAKMLTLYLEFGPENVTVRPLESSPRFYLRSGICSS